MFALKQVKLEGMNKADREEAIDEVRSVQRLDSLGRLSIAIGASDMWLVFAATARACRRGCSLSSTTHTSSSTLTAG